MTARIFAQATVAVISLTACISSATAADLMPLNPDVKQASIATTICQTGWTRTVRPYVSTMKTIKAEMLAEVGEPIETKSSAGSRSSAAFSTVSNNCRRLIPTRRMTAPFIRSSASTMAALDSASEKNVLLRESAKNVALGEADARLDLGLVARLVGACRQNADTIMVRHHAVTAVDLRVIERGLVDADFEIVGDDQTSARRRRSGTSAHASRSSPAAVASSSPRHR